MMKKVCKVCGAEFPAAARYCPECGARQSASALKKRIAAGIFSILALLTLFGVSLHFILRSQESEAREKAAAESAARESIAVQQAAYEIAKEVAVRDSLMADSTASGR